MEADSERERARFPRRWIVLLAALVLLPCGCIFIQGPMVMPGASLRIAEATAPDGTEMCATQFFTGTLEPYEVAFYYRRPGQRWGWFYIDHEDSYWWSGHISLDASRETATLWRGRNRCAEFNWRDQAFTLVRWNRRIVGAQEWRDPDVPWGVAALRPSPLAVGFAALPVVSLGFGWALAIGLLSGHLKLRLGLRTNYTRKIFHFAIFSAAMGIHAVGGFAAVNAYAVGVVAVILWGVWRGEGHIIFEGMARERDAPHRGFYVVVPLITTALGGLVSNWLAGDFALVGYLVTGWGDAVGEPIGTWIGRHRFRVLSLTGIPSERSLEGCAAVFLASFLAALSGLATLGLAASLPVALGVAVVATVLESVSPHGSDNFTTMAGAALAAQALTAWLT